LIMKHKYLLFGDEAMENGCHCRGWIAGMLMKAYCPDL